MNEIVSRSTSASDLAQADAHPIKPHEYKELPELTDDMLARAVVNKDGRPEGRINLGSELTEIGPQAGGFHLENERDEVPHKKISYASIATCTPKPNRMQTQRVAPLPDRLSSGRWSVKRPWTTRICLPPLSAMS